MPATVPAGTPNFTDIHFHDASYGWIVGDAGTIWLTTDGGVNWDEPATVPAGTPNFTDIHFHDASYGWIVGDTGTIWLTTNGGVLWAVPTTVPAGTPNLTNVHFHDASYGWIVGDTGTIWLTTNGGVLWAVPTTVPAGTPNLTNVHFYDATNGWSVGAAGTIWLTIDGGVNWVMPTSVPAGTPNLTDVHFISSNDGWAVGDSATILVTSDGGDNWTNQLVQAGVTSDLTNVYFVDSDNGWAVGADGTILNIKPSFLLVTALQNKLMLEITNASDVSVLGGFRLSILQSGVQVEEWDNMTISDIKRKVNGVSKYIKVDPLGNTRPLNKVATALSFYKLVGGWDGLEGLMLKDDTLTIECINVSSLRDGVKITIDNATSGHANQFKLIVNWAETDVDVFDDLTMATVEREINGSSGYIQVDKISDTVPSKTAYSEVDVPLGLKDIDFLGDEATKNGLHAFDTVDDINILAIPDRPGDREAILGALTYCENRKDCFYVADAPLGITPMEALDFKQATGDYSGNAFNSSFGALYYPWIKVVDPLTGTNKLVPPSGALAGTYSATDIKRGVHKAPAGTLDGYLNSSVGVEYMATHGEQELLNPNGINVIRSFPASGINVWGARTLSSDPEWTYINVRRLILFIEESIDQATQWIVFEPNSPALWESVKRDVKAFLTVVWRSGALFGLSAEEAFFVKIDSENNPPEMQAIGRLYIDIGVAPVKPAEFVIFRITQMTRES